MFMCVSSIQMPEVHVSLTCLLLFQRIQTVSATDPDEPIGGHKFFFSLAQEAAGKANFSVRDNKGNTLPADACGHQINFNLLYNIPIRHLWLLLNLIPSKVVLHLM